MQHYLKVLTLLLFPCCLLAGKFTDHLQKGGGDTQYLQTIEDQKRVGFFSALFDMAEKRETAAGMIPRTLHFIWLGPRPFPKGSVANVSGWIDRHPGWKVKFWTDLGHTAPDDRMEVSVFDQFPLEELKECYYHCDNFGERSAILRYAILLHAGGIYVDHDVACVKPLDTLQAEYDFFCGLEPLGPTILSSSVNPSPHLLAATAQHPILDAAKKWLIKEWDRLDTQYPGSDCTAIYNRVQHRAFRALSMGIKEAHSRAGRKDVVFPPDYFSLGQNKEALFAVHYHSGSWHTKLAGAEQKGEKLFNQVKEEFSRTVILALILTVLNVGFGIFWVYRFFQAKNKRFT